MCVCVYIVVFDCMCNTQKFFVNAHFLYYRFNLIILSSSTCFEHPNVHPQENLYMKFYGISFMHWLYERNTIKLHEQVFLRMNIWMLETCRRDYN